LLFLLLFFDFKDFKDFDFDMVLKTQMIKNLKKYFEFDIPPRADVYFFLTGYGLKDFKNIKD